MQRRSYPRNYLERHGQVNIRSSPPYSPRQNIPIHKTDGEPDCIIFVSKRKGWGSLGNKESQPFSQASVDCLIESFPSDQFHRYIVKVYLKKEI